MSAIMTRVRGGLRLARGRCPSCASEAPEGCEICLGHRAPFPVEPARLRRWEARFEASLKAPRSGLRALEARADGAATFASL